MAESAGASVVEEKETATHLIYQATVSKPDNEHCTPLQGKISPHSRGAKMRSILCVTPIYSYMGRKNLWRTLTPHLVKISKK